MSLVLPVGQRGLFAAGGLAGLSAVGMASAAAHAFNGLAPDRLQAIRSALQVHGWHAVALLAVALWLPRGGRLTLTAGGCFVAGLVVFCGAVYAQALGLLHVPGAAPVGGSLLLAGWVLLTLGALRPGGPGA